MSQHKGEHGTKPTVKIKVAPHDGNEDGVVEINESDYDKDIHELVDEESAPKDSGKKGKKSKA